MVAVGTFMFLRYWMRNCRYFPKRVSSILERNSPKTFGQRKLTQTYTSHSKTTNTRQFGGKTCTQTKNKSKCLNNCVNLFEFRLRVLRVSSCLYVWGLRGLLAYRVCTPIVLYSPFLHLNKGQFAWSWNPPSWASSSSPISTITTLLRVFLSDNSIIRHTFQEKL